MCWVDLYNLDQIPVMQLTPTLDIMFGNEFHNNCTSNKIIIKNMVVIKAYLKNVQG